MLFDVLHLRFMRDDAVRQPSEQGLVSSGRRCFGARGSPATCRCSSAAADAAAGAAIAGRAIFGREVAPPSAATSRIRPGVHAALLSGPSSSKAGDRGPSWSLMSFGLHIDSPLLGHDTCFCCSCAVAHDTSCVPACRKCGRAVRVPLRGRRQVEFALFRLSSSANVKQVAMKARKSDRCKASRASTSRDEMAER